MKKVFIVTLILVLASCNNDNAVPKKENVEIKSEVIVPVKPEKFTIELEIKSSETDKFKMYANKIFINNTKTMNITIIQKVVKSTEFNSVVFDFPENIKPDVQVSISLGTSNVKSIEIEMVKISYGDMEFDISSKEIEDYFTYNKFVDYDSETGIIKTKKVDGKLNPLLILRKKIVNKINI